MRSKLKAIKFLGFGFVGVFIIVLLFMGYHYFIQGQIIENSDAQVIVNESYDMAYLRTKADDELQDIGFTADELDVINKMNQDQVSLGELLHALFDEPGLMEEAEMNVDDPLDEYNRSQEEKEEGIPFVNIYAEPVETIHLIDNETFVTKIHYTASVNRPSFFQRQDFFDMHFNAWNRLFGYAKLHYASHSGETYEEYVIGDPILDGFSESDFRLAFDVRKRENGEWFYLTEISGMLVMEARSDLNMFGQYHHQRLSGHKVTGNESLWKMDLSKY